MQFNGVTFKNQRVRLDGGQFRDCVFDNVVLEYGGGALSLEGCRFAGEIGWALDGDFGRGLAAFGALYQERQALGLKTIVESMFPKRVPQPRSVATLRKAA
jgi:hypothetical protein